MNLAGLSAPMRAMLLTAAGRFASEERPLPQPGPGQLLVRTQACGLCASELDVFLGRNPWQQYPAALGHEGVGQVMALGPGVADWQEGERVAAAAGSGCYADWFTLDAAAAVRVPAEMSAHLAMAEPLGCAVNTVEEIAARLGDTVVILGAGFIGLALTQLLRGGWPAWLLVAARRREARQLAVALGATESCAPDAVQRRVWELTGGAGADIVVEATGSEEMLAIAASLLRPEGTLAIVGYHQGLGRQVPIHEWNWKALRIANCHFRSTRRMVDGATRGLGLASSGAIDLARLVTHRFPLGEIQHAFETAAARPEGYVKAVLIPDANQ